MIIESGNIYIVERRSNRIDYPTIEDRNCFIGSTSKKCRDWMFKNKNCAGRENYWWWTMYTGRVDSDDQNTATYRHFDWDGEELSEEPLGMELSFTNDLSKVKVGEFLYTREGRKYLITELVKTSSGFAIWSDIICLEEFKYKNKKNADTPKYARLVLTNEL